MGSAAPERRARATNWPPLIYLRLALILRPDHDLAAVTLANLLSDMKQPEAAIRAYENVPKTSPMRESAEIQAAMEYDALGHSDEAMERMNAIVAAHPKDPDAWSALGSLQRSAKKFEEAARVLRQGDRTGGNARPRQLDAVLFPRHLLRALEAMAEGRGRLQEGAGAFPDQPLVLNYLGYSWVDQGVNLDEAFKMLRRAVDLKPTDGYIVDSLGWAHYKLGHYDEATQELEHAIELKPADPVVNDHLGDAYWRVGRKIEAHFQWNHARDMQPEPEDLPNILEKIKSGLPDAAAKDAPAATPADRPRPAAELGARAVARQVWRAPAKVNLTLHVLARREDGYHEIESLVAFAGVGDVLEFVAGGAAVADRGRPDRARSRALRRQSRAARRARAR